MRSFSAFDMVHPALLLGAFTVIIGCTMLAIHPILLTISFVCAIAFSLYARGWLPTAKTLAWQIPLIALCALINPLFSAVGSTELFRIGTRAVYLESVVYGACMGLMLAAVMLWFFNATVILTTDKVMSVMGNTMPTIGLMISMMMRLVPQFVARGTLITDTAHATSAAAPRTMAESTAVRLRQVSVLMGWSMEDSLETADAMRARGWGAATRRTTYQRYRFRSFDGIILVILGTLSLVSIVLAWRVTERFSFFPTISPLAWWWGYAPYALLMGLPLLIGLADDARWRRLS
ncbi:MAG: energy-coupling factor transporter transmembrane protein EcfT [Coriobacteriia bacterium]|nr:energy-coupling factor transporter transmembrane protein EcfT [Coriobacteriia bacterium]